MRRLIAALAAAALAALVLAPLASADFGVNEFDVTFTGADGSVAPQAGAHPFAATTSIALNTIDPELGKPVPDGDAKDLTVAQIAGLVGNPTATPRCTTADFLVESCARSTIVGQAEVSIADRVEDLAVYNLVPPPGVVLKLGFRPLKVAVTAGVKLNPEPPYNPIAEGRNIVQAVAFFGLKLTLWGVPADPAHDAERGGPVDIAPKPFLTVPRACEGPLEASYEVVSWQDPTTPVFGSILTHDDSTPPNPLGFIGCGKLGFEPHIAAQPTTASAESPTGMDVSIKVEDEGLVSPTGLAQSEMKKAVVRLPKGVTANPSLAEGLGVCTQAQFESEAVDTPAGGGCPNASKIGDVEVKTPLLEGQILTGSLFIAKPHDNPFGSLIALYIVFRSQELGILVKQAGVVEPDPQTGQLVTTFSDVPQLPFSDLKVHLREGARSPLISPPNCGTHTTVAELTPWANPSHPLITTSSFQITSGPNGGPCPSGGTLPFDPGFTAGAVNNNAGSYSPFDMRITRRDGDQDLTRFDVTLPPGVTGKLAGVSRCSDASIAAAKLKTGKQELASPSCPANSKIGSLLGGAGVGSVLTYVPGSLYLAGPFAGAPLSVVGIVPAVAGPFDVGTIVVREALTIDPKTALVKADGALSDPIPHILAGIPLKVRDIRVNVDRPGFTLNPTSCNRLATGAALWGGGNDLFSKADDAPVSRSERFQAASCSHLGFKPRLILKLKGGTKRGSNPALTAILRPRPGDANISGAIARLPRSEFLDQSHIRTVCTRVQFAASACPAGSVYGRATATTPLFDFPLSGPVYLRSSDNKLPDLVADLRGPPSLPIRFEVVGRTDSIRGGIRNTFDVVPDAPVSEFVLRLRSGQKGLLINSTDICRHAFRARATFAAHNGKRIVLRPKLQAQCAKRR
jgi:hypothetical protein